MAVMEGEAMAAEGSTVEVDFPEDSPGMDRPVDLPGTADSQAVFPVTGHIPVRPSAAVEDSAAADFPARPFPPAEDSLAADLRIMPR